MRDLNGGSVPNLVPTPALPRKPRIPVLLNDGRAV